MNVLTTDDGGLHKYSPLGGYPLFYIDGNNEVLCRGCAQEALDSDFEQDRPVACEVNWEDPNLFCNCGERIESAYADNE